MYHSRIIWTTAVLCNINTTVTFHGSYSALRNRFFRQCLQEWDTKNLKLFFNKMQRGQITLSSFITVPFIHLSLLYLYFKWFVTVLDFMYEISAAALVAF
jgi:hypothetical protein